MARSRRRVHAPVRFEMAPLMDVVFILLIFFAVSSTVVMQNQGMNLQLPAAKSVQKHVPGLVVQIDQNQRVYIDQKRIEPSTLKKLISDRLAQDPSVKVILRADRLTPYSHVVRVLDSIRLGGAYDVVLEARADQDRP